MGVNTRTRSSAARLPRSLSVTADQKTRVTCMNEKRKKKVSVWVQSFNN